MTIIKNLFFFSIIAIISECCYSQINYADSLRSKLPYKFAFDFMYPKYKSSKAYWLQTMRKEWNDSIELQFIPSNDSNTLEEFTCGAICSLHSIKSILGKEKYYLLSTRYPELGPFYLFSYDSINPVVLDSLQLPSRMGHFSFEELNGCNIVKFEYQVFSVFDRRNLDLYAIVDGKFYRLFSTELDCLVSEDNHTDRTLTKVTFEDLNKDGYLDILVQTSKDRLPEYDYELFGNDKWKTLPFKKHLSKSKQRYLWNPVRHTFNARK
jgi:hypothetical protein